ncbi:MAG: MarC family protein [Victivallaceae bacterium]|nr:MarC family protein [Victivallaceae bacterium]
MIAILTMMVKMLWMLTPFFGLAMFLNFTDGMEECRKRRIAVKCTLWVWILSMIFFFLGSPLFKVLGVTLDGFRIGAGVTLFITALGCIAGSPSTKDARPSGGDFSIVPLAIPFSVGPGMIGMIMIYAVENSTLVGMLGFTAAVTAAVAIYGGMLVFASFLHRIMGDEVIRVLSRITGLFLAALAGQMIVVGVRNIWLG